MSELMKNLPAILSGIRARRIKKMYSQEYMAYKMSCSQNAYSKIELGYSKITLIQLFKIAEILEVKIPELLDCEEFSKQGQVSQ